MSLTTRRDTGESSAQSGEKRVEREAGEVGGIESREVSANVEWSIRITKVQSGEVLELLVLDEAWMALSRLPTASEAFEQHVRCRFAVNLERLEGDAMLQVKQPLGIEFRPEVAFEDERASGGKFSFSDRKEQR